MVSCSVREVQQAIAAKETGSLPPLTAFLVNFKAPVVFPRKFIYHGCSKQVGNGRPCSKTVEGLYACPHSAGQEGKWVPMYWFDIFLVDESIKIGECLPLRATIFSSAAGELIGMSPTEFSQKPDFEQYAIVHAVTTRMHEVRVLLHLKEHQGAVNCTVQSLVLLGDDECQILHTRGPNLSTPKHSKGHSITSPSIYHTPRSTMSSSHGRQSPGLSVVKAQLQDLLDSLESTHIDE
ncbi:unnamed protein product [Calypogeia fissa]